MREQGHSRVIRSSLSLGCGSAPRPSVAGSYGGEGRASLEWIQMTVIAEEDAVYGYSPTIEALKY